VKSYSWSDNPLYRVKKWYNFLYALLTLSNINRFWNLFHCQNQGKICHNAITKDPTTPQVCCYTTLWNVTEWSKLLQSFIDHAIGQWNHWLECVIQQQCGHTEHLMWILRDETVTLGLNWDNKRVVYCCYMKFVKMCCYRSRLVFNLLLRHDISQGNVATHLRCT